MPTPNSQTFDVIILGAGAAGLMCAIEASRRGRRVALLDHADRAGKKILISGGGRCNFTNLHTTPENFLSENPHFARSALARFTPADMIARVERHRIPYHEKTLGQLFCDRSAQDITSMLERECAEAGVQTFLMARILKVSKDGPFLLETSAGLLRAQSLVVATGGLSIPKMGATELGYRLAEQFGMGVVECRPALVPLTFPPEERDRWCDLTGISLTVDATAGDRRYQVSFREKMLMTHRGLSGPSILQISSYWSPGSPVALDLAPGMEVTAPLRAKNARRDPSAALAALRSVLPTRFAERWMELQPPEDWTNASLDRFEQGIHRWEVRPAGTEGYAKAEVTAGGVDTVELDAKTLQSKRVPGLFFVGEVVDVTGWLGGYNFQWAWASGVAAGQAC